MVSWRTDNQLSLGIERSPGTLLHSVFGLRQQFSGVSLHTLEQQFDGSSYRDVA